MDKFILSLALLFSYGILGISAWWIWNKLPWKPEGGKTELSEEAFEAAIGHRVKAMIVILVMSTVLGIASLFSLVSTDKDCKERPNISVNCPSNSSTE
uniref:Uncharacterized protein n=1 Tax=Candidatus Kentrum sp. DK TaxID=2126562 RepID=A0A450S233_9GAMM|nr:MAG: hypothetical protein BECKDK2373C_GA0170839_101230 [Candidatus Kentron sp. DK]